MLMDVNGFWGYMRDRGQNWNETHAVKECDVDLTRSESKKKLANQAGV